MVTRAWLRSLPEPLCQKPIFASFTAPVPTALAEKARLVPAEGKPIRLWLEEG